MSVSRRALLASVPLTALAAGVGARQLTGAPSASTAVPSDALTTGATMPAPSGVAQVADGAPLQARAATTTAKTTAVKRRAWVSGVVGTTSRNFAIWRGSTVKILGLYADASVAAQLEQYQIVHNTFTGDIDLAVGGPIDHTWAETADGAEVDRWIDMAGLIKSNWRFKTLYLRYAHEANGNWMPWSVAPTELAAFRTAFRLFATTMRRELAGRNVKIVFGPNFGSWRYAVNSMWPGNDVVDVVGLSLYEWDSYNTEAKWKKFAASSLGPDYWLKVAASHGKPLALSEWGARSSFFLTKMNSWLAAHGGTTKGTVLYDVYQNKDSFTLTGGLGTRYRSLPWGR